MTERLRKPDAATLARLKEAVGPKGFIADAVDMEPHLVEWRDKWRGSAASVLRPASTAEVAAIMRICAEARVGVVPQGGNTGLVGGQIPDTSGDQIVLSLGRMNRVRDIDAANNTMTVDAGCILKNLQDAASEADRLFPLSLGSEGSAQIGGLLSTNAGGVNVLRYGNARELVLGLEVVLADGRVWSGLRRLRKDNTGYDLKHVFLGSEGTLGIITAAVLKLFPKPRATAVAFVPITNPAAGIALLNRLKGAFGDRVTAFELMPRIGLEFVLRHVPGTVDPCPGLHSWYVLIEIASFDANEDVVESLFYALEDAQTDNMVVSGTLGQATSLWRLREEMSGAQKPEGGSIKHDVAVPVSRIAEFLEVATAAVLKLMPDARPVPFGHLGDGNIHFNISQPVGADRDAFLSRWREVNAVVHAIVRDMGGSISAEHGVGVLKRDEIAATKDAVEMDLMRTLKRALDPHGILNPGKVVVS